MPDGYMNKATVIREYGVTAHALEKAWARGHLRKYKLGRTVLFKISDIDEWNHRYDDPYLSDGTYMPWLPSWWPLEQLKAEAARWGVDWETKTWVGYGKG